MSDPPPHEDVLFDSDRTGLPRRILVSGATGLAFWAMTAFTRWGLHPGGDLRAAWIPRAIGLTVALALIAVAVMSRVVRRVVLDPARRTLVLYRDPGAVDILPLADLVGAASEAPVGGWSRDPSERLALTLRDGSVRRYSLPDDADTPGIVADITRALSPSPAP